MSYDKNFVAGLEWLWGEGFLSPGGPESIAEILRGTDLKNKSVFDFGCGIGGIDRLLINAYGASRIVGVDVVGSLIERAKLDAEKYGLVDRIQYQQIESGLLDFADNSFDVVFSKDTIVHLTDKPQIFGEFFRILRSDGILVGSDWLGSDATESSELIKEWLDYSKLDFHFCTAAQLQEFIQSAGFETIQLRDKNAWYRSAIRQEIGRVTGSNRNEFVEKFGEEQANTRVTSSTLKMKVVDAGELRPTLFRAVKP